MPTPTPNKLDPTTDTPFRALIRTYGLIGRIMQPYFAGFGISGAQWGVLRNLHRAELEGIKSLRLTDLGKRLIIRPPSVTSVVDRLVRMGLVDRDASTDDRRVKFISLSTAGRQLVGRILKQHDAKIDSLLEGLSSAEQQQLKQLLVKLTTHLQSKSEQQHLPPRPQRAAR